MSGTVIGSDPLPPLPGRLTPAADVIQAGSGQDVLIGLGGNDTLRGGAGDDSLHGGTGADRLRGQDGADVLAGDEGSDRLFGGSGQDVLRGGKGRDVLDGGRDADRFVFASRGDTGTSVDRADRIVGFSRAQDDLIDLSEVDAKRRTSRDDDFIFIGERSYSGRAGELRWNDDANRLQGDTDGNGTTDLWLKVSVNFDLSRTDLLL
ncbi:calcium-binding protein [Rubellimicrobium roseum]|uniref:Calcium-binding protein n=1 Tax=Rubellimicrobium roseum TaxID=687525 RepID=A0A5C4NAC4_9RHOB|nr:calcium-binding protein [Rubellimicrobium roseum]